MLNAQRKIHKFQIQSYKVLTLSNLLIRIIFVLVDIEYAQQIQRELSANSITTKISNKSYREVTFMNFININKPIIIINIKSPVVAL